MKDFTENEKKMLVVEFNLDGIAFQFQISPRFELDAVCEIPSNVILIIAFISSKKYLSVEHFN